jgi:hypothetical protein
MKTLAFVAGLLIATIGAVGIVVPSGLVWSSQFALTSAAFYAIGGVRVALGLLFVSVASASRAPKPLRVLGYFILVAGIVTAATGLVAMERARAIIEWYLQQGTGVVRVAGVSVLALGGFIAYACAPARRAV